MSVDSLRSRGIDRPFRGVRSAGVDLHSVTERCRAYRKRMHPLHVFRHRTAALLWDVPLPLSMATPGSLDVTAPSPLRAPSGKGVRGHQFALDPSQWTEIDGLRVTTPEVTWVQLATELSWIDLVAAGDWLVTGNSFRRQLPHASVELLRAEHARSGRSRGRVARERALAFVGPEALSRPESLIRVLCLLAGLPEPLVNANVHDDRGSFLAMPDLHWPEFRVALEYEGDHHREVAQFRRDIHRLERLVDERWVVVKVSAEDLYDRTPETIARVGRRLASGGWTGRVELAANRAR